MVTIHGQRKWTTGLIPYLQENKMCPEIHIFTGLFLVRYDKRNKDTETEKRKRYQVKREGKMGDKNMASEKNSDLL
jgi:hypothetical protein